MKLANVSKGLAGAVAGMLTGNAGMIAMSAEQLASMPWWGVVVANLAYAAIGFATVWIAPRNTPA